MSKKRKAGISRRDLFRLGGAAAAGVVGASALAGCAPRSYTPYDQGTIGAQGNASSTTTGLPSFMIPPEPITDIAEVVDYDVVVVGSGAAGTPAGLSALEAGASVAVLQKEFQAISQGNTGTGIDLETSDPAAVQALVSRIIKDCQNRADRELLELWAMNSGEAMLWVVDRVNAGGGPMENTFNSQQTLTNINGQTLNFFTTFAGPKPLTAGDAMRGLAKAAEDAGVVYYYSTPGKQLVTDDEGNVTGVIGQREDGSYIQLNAKKGVILATGDYQNNEEMCDYYIPDIHYIARKQNRKTGDGHQMALWVGGSMRNIGHTKMIHDFDAGPASMCDMPFLAVAQNGKRFVDETIVMDELNNYLAGPENTGWYAQIFDSKYMEDAADWKGGLVPPEGLKNYMPDEPGEKTGVFPDQIRTFCCDTIEELAEKLEMDPATLKETVDRYNELVKKGMDDDFGKDPAFLVSVEKPPFYGIHRRLRVSALTEGLKINSDYNVLRADDTPIKGLYAIGNCSGGFYGGVDYPMTVPGLSLGRCYTAGYVCGKNVASL